MFSVLIVPPLVMPQGQIQLSIDNQYLLAGIFTIWLAWKYRKFVIAVGGGTGFMLAFRWLAS
ncbi:MAG: AzlD domain-containing protein [Negativicutes bacterium]|nr:AzlD domain-containing protein [Negativicutes bacterium]